MTDMSAAGEKQPIGPMLDALGVTADLQENDQITDVLVIAKVLDFASGNTAVGIYHNNLDWIAQLGLHTAADHVLRAEEPEHD